MASQHRLFDAINIVVAPVDNTRANVCTERASNDPHVALAHSVGLLARDH
mgnify:CR=1 FL=1